jgi:predicted MPP superfamily phosphohydrolase
MSKIAWCTDIHLDHLYGNEERLIKFAQSLVAAEPQAVAITGDISSAKEIVFHLSALERVIQRPIYFVLGNHDYYGGGIDDVRKQMKDLGNISPFLKYLPTSNYVPLTPSTAVLGHDGWYDALNGDGNRSKFMMNDWVAIRDFVPHSGGSQFMMMNRDLRDRNGLIAHARKLATEGVTHVQNSIKAATRYHRNLIILTHYPPFAESHIYNGRVGDSDAQPWFTSKMMGDMLLQAAKAYPNVNFTVLAGHTHGKYDGKPLPNLHVHVGGAEYGQPALAALIDVV